LALPIIGFPILDTLTVMVVRIKNRRSPFSPDKNHFHHQMLNLGFFHTEAVLSIYLIQSCFVIFALVTRFHSEWLHLTWFAGLSAVILGGFFAARTTGWKLHREGWFDRGVKQRLRFIKEQKIFIRVAFSGVRYLFFLLLAVQVMIPDQIPLYLSLAALVLVLLTGVGYVCRLERFKSNVLRFSVYMVVPLLVYLSEIGPGAWVRSPWVEVIHLGYVALVFFVIMTMNLTRRRHGFKISPLDILVFVIVLVFSNLPAFYLQDFRVGMMLTKGLILYYSFDVFTGELRGSTGILFKPVLAVLSLVAVRGLF
jgi:UDP-GlcNAc:undecaprenyl-phosphate GlcNAc-1-phosphate transferase